MTSDSVESPKAPPEWGTAVGLAVVLLVGAACDDDTSPDTDETAPSAGAKAESAPGESQTASAEHPGEENAPKQGAEPDGEPPRLLRGRITPGRVTERYPEWRKRVESVEIDEEDAAALGDVPPGAEVTVYLGTWCPDSRREVPRLWKALRSAGGDVPFSVEYIALDRDFDAGDVSLEGADVQYVPTFVVERKGEEVGRIVESAPDDLERDLHGLLSGEKQGILSKRDDL